MGERALGLFWPHALAYRPETSDGRRLAGGATAQLVTYLVGIEHGRVDMTFGDSQRDGQLPQ